MDQSQYTVMVVDDSRLARASLVELLKREGYATLLELNSSQAAMDYLGLEPVAEKPTKSLGLILLDIVMDGLDGIGLCQRIKADQRLRDIPVIMLTAKGDVDSLRQAFQAGAMDYITKPYREAELALRVRSALTLKAEVDRRKARESELVAVTEKLVSLNQKLRQLSNLDGLTGIANRRLFEETYRREWRRGQRQGRNLAVLMIDIDHFKAYNDNLGHAQGDECLRRVARCLRDGLHRPGDFLARYGGEEFVVVLPETDQQGAMVVAEELRRGVQDLALPHPASSAGKVVTVSIGVAAVVPTSDVPLLELLAEADRALYQAKGRSRNRVHCRQMDASNGGTGENCDD